MHSKSPVVNLAEPRAATCPDFGGIVPEFNSVYPGKRVPGHRFAPPTLNLNFNCTPARSLFHVTVYWFKKLFSCLKCKTTYRIMFVSMRDTNKTN